MLDYIVSQFVYRASYGIGVGLVVFLVLLGISGLTIYATYQGCDPVMDGKIKSRDQVFICNYCIGIGTVTIYCTLSIFVFFFVLTPLPPPPVH